MSDLFEKALSDICGKVRVGGDDRRWSDLFSSNLQPYIVRDNNSNSSSSSNLTTTETLVHHFERLINHNPTTGNYVQLLDQAMARLRDISRKKTEPPMNSIETCCVSLYLCSIITHHFIARLEVTEVRINHECIIIILTNFYHAYSYEDSSSCLRIGPMMFLL